MDDFRFCATPRDFDALRELKREIGRYAIGDPLQRMYRPRINCSMGPGGILDLCVTIHVPHRDTGETIPVKHSHTLSPYTILEATEHRQNFLRHVFRSVWMEILLHELEESVLYDGKRIWDPHASDSAAAPLAPARP